MMEVPDMNTRRILIAAAVSLLLPGSALLAQENSDTFNFGATLSGAQEPVPADAPATPSLGVSTQMTGTLEMAVLPDLSSLTFRLVVQKGVKVTASHLHCGRPGENGPIIVPLSTPSQEGQDVSGVLAEGTIRSENIDAGATACEQLIGRPVRNIASLTAAAVLGLIYANVHTVANPSGEIRGQLIVGVKPTPAPQSTTQRH
jgi:hypothetical protein